MGYYQYESGYFYSGGDYNDAGCDEEYTIIYTHGNDLPDGIGYMYGYGGIANDMCLNAKNSDFEHNSCVWLWDNCTKGHPQKNRVWEYVEEVGYIRNVYDPRFCLRRATAGEVVDGDRVVLGVCSGFAGLNQEWTYDAEDQQMIRVASDDNYCMVRDGWEKKAAIKIARCNPGNSNHLWAINPTNKGRP